MHDLFVQADILYLNRSTVNPVCAHIASRGVNKDEKFPLKLKADRLTRGARVNTDVCSGLVACGFRDFSA
jgi:hypothetical protein